MESRTPLQQCIALIVAGVLFLNPIVSTAAQLAVDAAANANTRISQAGNGVPVVDIATPNGSGLSNNTFRDYNVGSNGLILNNATSKTQATQLGGIIVGNPNLEGQAAKVILNQVSGANRSTLQGYTEVAGQGARVIVANPHGITCNGCGFINTPRATLTTGKPIMDGEHLDRFQVEGGDIIVEGEALNASDLDQFDLITRSAKLNTALHARQLNIVAGRNSVEADSLDAQPLAGDGSEKPQLAIDSSALGGMYANTIRLVGTEQGVGVKLAGNMATTTGDIQVDANGKVTLSQASSAADLRVTAQRAQLIGATYAAGSATVRSLEEVQVGQSLAARQRITVESSHVENRGIIEAGVEPDNTRNAQGDVLLTAQNLRNIGNVVASRRLNVEASGTLDNRGGRLIGVDSLQVSAARLDNRDSGLVGSDRQARLTTHGELDNRNGGKLSADRLDIRTAQLHNTSGQLVGGDILLAASAAIDNRLGLISAQHLLDLRAVDLNNSDKGQLLSSGALQVKLATLDNRNKGVLSSLGNLSLQGDQLDNRGGQLITDGSMSVSGGHFDNRNEGAISSKGQTRIQVASLDNSAAGSLHSDSGLELTAGSVDNQRNGRIVARGDLQAHLGTLTQQGGSLTSLGSLLLTADTVDNQNGGDIGATNQIDLRATRVLNQGGEISSAGKVVLSAGQLLDNRDGRVIGESGLALMVQRLLNQNKGLLAGHDRLTLQGTELLNNDGKISSHKHVELLLDGALDNSDAGQIISGGTLKSRVATLRNINGGMFSALGATQLASSGLLDNQGGRLVTSAGLQVTAGSLDNSKAGVISVGGHAELRSGALDNSSKGNIGAGSLLLVARQLDNHTQGRISAEGQIEATLTGLDQHAHGQLVSSTGIDLNLQGGLLRNNDEGLLRTPGRLLLRQIGVVENRAGGEISSDQNFSLSASALDNRGGRLVSAHDLDLRVAEVLDNSVKGVVSASRDLEVQAAQVLNAEGGTLASGQTLQATVTGQLDNHAQGTLSAGGALRLTSGALLNSEGGLLSGKSGLDVATGRFDNHQGGQLVSQAAMNVTSAALDNRGGILSSQQALQLTSGDLDNGADEHQRGGRIHSDAELKLDAGKVDSSHGGEISAKGDLLLRVSALIQRQGRLIGEQKLDLDVNGGHLINQGGLISANGLLNIQHLGVLDNAAGEISSLQSFSLIAQRVDNRQGRLLSEGQLKLETAQLNNSDKGLVSGLQGVQVQGSKLDNSRGGTLSSRAGTLNVTLDGTLDNREQGAVVSKGSQRISAATLDNRQGIISSEHAITLNVRDQLDNSTGGLISALDGLALDHDNTVIDNHRGRLSGETVTVVGKRLNNDKGQLISRGALDLTLTGALLNTHGANLTSGADLLLKAGQVDNRGGRLISQAALRVDADRLDNSLGGNLASHQSLVLRLNSDLINSNDGLLFSEQGKLDIQAVALNNQDGTLKSQGNVEVRLELDLNNKGGRLESEAGDLDLRAANLYNADGGMLSASKGAFKGLFSELFDNAGGTTQAQSVALQARVKVNNQGGFLSALGGDQRIVTADLDNRSGGLYAAGLLQSQGTNLFNQGGKIGAGRIDFGLSGMLYNGLGQLESETDLTLRVNGLDNQAGSLRALGKTGTSRLVIADTLVNDNGVLAASNQNLDLQTRSLSNTGGELLHTGTGAFGLTSAQVMQAGGTLYTNGLLSLSADSWTNNSVLQARRLDLSIGRFVQTADGKLLAVERFTGRGHDWTNHGLLASDGSLELDLSGRYDGNGRLSSLGDLRLSADAIQLTSAASLAGGADTSVIARQQLGNDGRLTAVGALMISAADLENRGTLGSADTLHVTADSLFNQRGLLFSGADMTLRVDSLRNDYGDLYSLGGLDLAGKARARAALLENISGSLESAGSMTLAVETLLNRKDVLTSRRELIGGNVDVYWDDVCKGKGCEAYFRASEIRQDVIDRDSPSAYITAGGTLGFSGQAFRNHYSNVSAGGDITISAAVFENKGAGGGEQRDLTASLYTRERDRYNAFIQAKERFNQNPGSFTLDQVMAASGYPQYSIYDVIDNTTPTAGAVIAQAVVQSAGAVTINAKERIDNSVVRASQVGAGALNTRDDAVADPHQALTQVRALNPQLPPDLAQRQVNPVTLPSFSLPQGENGLFRLSEQRGQVAASGDALGATGDRTQTASSVFIAPLATAANAETAGAQALSAGAAGAAQGAAGTDAGPGGLAAGVELVKGVRNLYVPSTSHRYLVETNPALTDLKQFLSSDYLLGRLGLSADQAIKRLGDGLYEQRLIRQAVVARTGQRYLDGLASDEALFRYLMDNAIASKDALSLSVGVSLSAEQVAALTHDIVWMEPVQVNGEKVLAPVLYLAHANGRLAPTGALIQGRDVDLITGGELNNVGTLRATHNLAASAANISNRGLIEAGGRLEMLATESIRNAQSGIIAGREVSLTALTGDVINERSVTRLEGRAGNEHVTQDLVDSAARIEATNNLTITAGQDIGDVGGVIKAGGDLRLDAGRDLYIGSQEGVDSHEYQRRRVSGHGTSVTQYGSEVSAGGNLTASAGQDLSIVASEVQARRDLALQAGRDVTLAAVENETHSYARGKKGPTKYERQEDTVTQQAAVVQAGGDLAVDAGRDLRLVASQASAGGEAYLVAGDKLELQAANDSQYSLYDMSKKGGWGSKKTQRDEVTDIKAVGSEVRSGRDLTLASGGDQLYQGARVAAGADLIIDSGGGVTFETVKDLQQESHEKSKGDLAWNSTKGKGNTDETVRQSQLMANGQVLIQAVDGLKVDVRQVNEQTVSQSIDAMVKADPQLAWLKDAEQRGDVDWRQVKEVHDSFKYSHSELGAGAQIVIAIIIAYFTAGAASGLVAGGATTAGASAGAGSAWAAGTGASLQGIGWANAAVTAGAVGMTSNAAISTINNKGNLSLVLKDITSKDALRGYAVAGVTAGLTTGLFEGWTGTKTEASTAAGTAGVTTNTTTVLSPGGLSSAAGLGRFAGSQVLQNGTSAVIDRALGGDSSFSDALRNSLVNTFAAAGFNWVGDISDESRLDLKEGRLPKVALHALMGGLAAEAAGGDFRIGALSAGVNEAVVGRLADQFDKMPEQERDKLLVMNSQILGVLTAAAAGGEAKDVQTGSWVAGSATSYNRLLHSTEKKALSAEAAELQKRLGKPGTDVSWEDLLLLAANAQVDQTEFARLDTLIKMYDPASPEGLHFLENLQTAQLSIEKLAGQNTVLKWEDGRAISANGSEVKAFQATAQQALDHGLFNTDSKWTQGGGGNWAGESQIVPEAWKQQFGERNAALYLREIEQVSSSPDEMKDLIGRVSTIATGGIKDVTIDLDVALALTGTGAALRALLAKRVSLATAEAGGGAGAKSAGSLVVDVEKAALDRITQNPKGLDLSSRAPNTVLNTQAVDGLKVGKLPGTPIGGPGTPREMPASANPSATAENFVTQVFGRSQIHKKPIAGCVGCWRGQTADGAWITYRPAGQASAATSSTTATIEINSSSINILNANPAGKAQILKLKFPVKGEVVP